MSNTSSSAVVSVNRVLCYRLLKVYYKRGRVYYFRHNYTDFEGCEIVDVAAGKSKKMGKAAARHAYNVYKDWLSCSYDMLAYYFRKAGITKIESRIFYDEKDARAKGVKVRTSITTWGEDGRVSFYESPDYTLD